MQAAKAAADWGGALAEQQRVRKHLAGAERAASNQREKLAPLQALTRRLLLAELRQYRRAGRFPQNHVSRQRTPVFVDPHGTHCAVAHLMKVSGQGALVQHVAATANYARVHELARLPQLRAWLAAAGLSLEEAARIQPSYCFYTQAEVCFCQEGQLGAVAVGVITAPADNGVLVRVDRIDGTFPEVNLGQEFVVEGAGKVGEQVLLSREADAGAFQRVGMRLKIEDDSVLCQVSAAASDRAVSIETVLTAMRADDKQSCINVLAKDNSAWNQSQCEEATSAPSSKQEGCSVASIGNPGDPALITTAALLAALVLHRRRRSGTS